jgi:hypothetical protein
MMRRCTYYVPSMHMSNSTLLLPTYYYDNVVAFPSVVTIVRKPCDNPLGYASKLVKKPKNNVTEEYTASLADLLVIRSRPHFTVVRSYLVSDLKRARIGNMDFGWGKATYGGAAKSGARAIPGAASFYVPFNNKGEDQIVVPISLPSSAMERFFMELDCFLTNKPVSGPEKSKL